ncbi:uncharacterized protein LOC135952544 [Calliphora vicina]|uniref:uncharacterized protein LOC135952544 n=1 Tax=Calliphora vicina TaxID=7373 RepID=UPI00325BACEB
MMLENFDMPAVENIANLWFQQDGATAHTAGASMVLVRDVFREVREVFGSWAMKNGLCLNPQKSKCLLIHNKTLKPNIENDIRINNEKIAIVQSAKNLGLVFNNNLSWSNHIQSLVSQTYLKLRTLWITQFYTPLRIRILIAKTYLIPGLIYGCELFANCDSNLLKIRVLIFLHKIIYTQQPEYLFRLLRFGRSPRGKNIIIPHHRKLVSEWQFLINATRLWNTLPHVQQINSNAMHFRKFL